LTRRVIRDLEKCIEKLYIAHVRFRTARNIIDRVRRRRFDEILFVSAVYGIPFSSMDMADLFVESGIKELGRVSRKLRDIVRYLEKNDPPRYLLFHRDLEEIIENIDQLLGSREDSLDRYIRSTEEIQLRLKEITSRLLGIYSRG